MYCIMHATGLITIYYYPLGAKSLTPLLKRGPDQKVLVPSSQVEEHLFDAVLMQRTSGWSNYRQKRHTLLLPHQAVTLMTQASQTND